MGRWAFFLKITIGTFVVLAAGLFIFVAVMNPYGNLPQLVLRDHVIQDGNQRYQYPALIRSRRFDSAVFGTSTSRLLKPSRLAQAFGGSFANFSMDDGRAWEQTQLAQLFLKHTPAPKTIVFALDRVWCAGNADTHRTTYRGWPSWIFDENSWNDWLYIFNSKSVEIALKQVAYYLGLRQPRLPNNGYKVFLPPEEKYDLQRARELIWKGRKPQIPEWKPHYQPTMEERADWRFPALAWLSSTLALVPSNTQIIVAFMPSHVAHNALPGSLGAARVWECKSQVFAITTKHGARFIDFWIRSPITVLDENYWDPLHYRVGIADRLVDEMKAAVDRPDKDNPHWRTHVAKAERPIVGSQP